MSQWTPKKQQRAQKRFKSHISYKISSTKNSYPTGPRGLASSATKSSAILISARKAREPSVWEDKVTNHKHSWRVPTNHRVQGKCRDIPQQPRPQLLWKTEVFCNTAKLVYWKSAGKHTDLPKHLRKHLAPEIPLRTTIPKPSSSGKLTVATGKSHLLKNSLRLAVCSQRENCACFTWEQPTSAAPRVLDLLR